MTDILETPTVEAPVSETKPRYSKPHTNLGEGFGLRLGAQSLALYLYLLDNAVGRDNAKSIGEIAAALPEISERLADPNNINAAVKATWEKVPIARCRQEGGGSFAYYVEADVLVIAEAFRAKVTLE
jgi:hypothetical protein